MNLYHGSKTIIKKPDYRGSKDDNDYGAAFYLTHDLESAHEWACRNDFVGYINKYKINLDKLTVLDLTDHTKYNVLNWIAILLHFRKLTPSFINSFKARLEFLEKYYFINPYEYDVVIGYRADDAYFRFPLDFVRGNITLEQLEVSFNLGDLGIQYVLMSEKSIKELEFVDAKLSDKKYINKYFERVKGANQQYNSLNYDIEGTRIFDVMKRNEQ